MKRLYEIEKEIQGIINAYEHLVRGIDETAKDSSQIRAYGGIIRAGKGKLVESIARQVVELAWMSLGEELSRLQPTRGIIKIPIRKEYIERIKSAEVKEYIFKNIHDYYYPLSLDLRILIDHTFVLAMECKTYTENAMLKRVLVDFTLLKQIYENITPVLFQLESQLGGDYSDLSDVAFGSPSTHTLLSYFDIDLHIITLLKGERKVDQPIHKKEYYKPLPKESLARAIKIISQILENYR